MLISEEYRALNRKLHEARPDYGTSGRKWARAVIELVASAQAETVLDYGCGKQTLKQALVEDLGLEFAGKIKGYDPAIEGLTARPDPAHVVVCGDVLEHIEPDCLDAVLDDLRRVTERAGLFVVATRPAKKTLEDGRNAHLIVEDMRWWLPRIWQRFDLVQLNNLGAEFMVVVTPRRTNGAA